MAIKVAKEIVSAATAMSANQAIVNSGLREQQKLCSQLSGKQKIAFEKMLKIFKQKKAPVNNFNDCLPKGTVKIQ